MAIESERSRVLLVDDHPIVREGLEARLSQEQDLAVAGSVADAAAAMEIIPRVNPDVVIADLSLGGKPGLEMIKDIARLYPALPVLVLSLHDESLWVERVLRAGAKGYINKSQGTEKVVEAVRRVLEGGVWVSEKMGSVLLQKLAKAPAQSSPLGRLSDRELEVFQMIGQGQSVKEIAVKLTLSPKTVEVHREHIKEKLGMKNSAELLRYAVTTALDAG
jgi:DNA-binding NarL/FixJ family response regulator